VHVDSELEFGVLSCVGASEDGHPEVKQKSKWKIISIAAVHNIKQR